MRVSVSNLFKMDPDMPPCQAKIGQKVPNFAQFCQNGDKIDFHHWLGDSWGLFVSFSAAFSPVCTSELISFSGAEKEFSVRNVKLIGNVCDEALNINEWIKDVVAFGKLKENPKMTLLADADRKVAHK